MESKQFKAKNWEIAEEKLENDLSVLNREEQYSERWSQLIHHLIHHLREGGSIIFQFEREKIVHRLKRENGEKFLHRLPAHHDDNLGAVEAFQGGGEVSYFYHFTIYSDCALQR